MWSCFVMDVFIGEGTNSSNVLFENNIFEAPTGSSGNANNAIYTSHAPDNWVVRYNTFGSSGITVVTDPTSRGMGRRQLLRRQLALRRAEHELRLQHHPDRVDNCGGPGAQSFSAATLHAGFLKYQPYVGDEGGSAQARRATTA
jgi:hypothetical protein